MKVEKDRFVTISYTLSDHDGKVLESSADRGAAIRFLYGSDPLIPGLAAVIDGLEEGDTKSGVIPAGGLSPRDVAPRRTVPVNEFPAGVDLAVGARFEAKGLDGHPVLFEIAESDDEAVEVLLLHPLHDEEVRYEGKVVDVRNPHVPSPMPFSESPDTLDLTDDLEEV